MNKYIGKVCPFCKSELKQGDNIVLCSACDMPHHKECWIENQGCTTFGCLGTIRSIDDTASTVTEEEIVYEETSRQAAGNVFCTRCGTPNTSSFSFCSKCGNKLSTGQMQTPPVYPQGNPAQNPFVYANPTSVYQQPVYNQNAYGNQNNFTYTNGYNSVPNYVNYNRNAGIDPDIVGLIGTNISYYVPRFQKMMGRNEKASWNWAAFFFAPYWFMYRKMYGYGIAMLAGCLFSIACLFIEEPFYFCFCFFCLLAGYIGIGICGNYIYMKELEKRARRAKAWSEPYHSQFIFRNSGGNVLAVVLSMIGYFVIYMLITYYTYYHL